MLVRRMATVTISAPEASIAARVSPKSLYLPVPTRSRERYARPAMTSGSSRPTRCGSVTVFMRTSAATHRGDDLDPVAGGEPRVALTALRHDLAVTLDRDALPLQRELAHEIGDGQRIVAAVRRAVEDNRQH